MDAGVFLFSVSRFLLFTGLFLRPAFGGTLERNRDFEAKIGEVFELNEVNGKKVRMTENRHSAVFDGKPSNDDGRPVKTGNCGNF